MAAERQRNSASRAGPDQALVEAIAQRVAELLRPELEPRGRLLTANQLADQWGVSLKWVYEHADELGAVRLGRGPKARLRFDLEIASQTLGCDRRAGGSESRRSDVRVRRVLREAPLLPIHGQVCEQ